MCRALPVFVVLSACAHGTVAPPLVPLHATRLELPLLAASEGDDPKRQLIVEQARALIDGQPFEVDGFTFERDPVGFVRAAYWAAGIDLYDAELFNDASRGGMALLYESLAKQRALYEARPAAGDLVFFDPPGSGGKLPAQVGVLESYAPDGTLSVLGVFRHGPARVRLNLRTHQSDVLRDEADHASAATLFRTFAAPLRDESPTS